MDSEESPNAQLKQRITELRQLLEKKKRKLQTSLRHSEQRSGPDSCHVAKRVRFSEPMSGSPLCSQNLFDDDSDAALAAALSESSAAFNCDLDASPSDAPAALSRLSAPCRFRPTSCDLLLRGPDAFLCLLSAQRVQVFCGPASGAAPLHPFWSRAVSRPTLLLARLLPDRPNLLLAEVKDGAVHIFCLEFNDNRLHSAYPLCALPQSSNLLSCGRPEGPMLLLANSPEAVHAALIAREELELRAIRRWERRFVVPCAVAIDSGRAVVLAQLGEKTRLGVLSLEDGGTQFFPSGAAQPKTVQLLREEGSLCFLGGLENAGERSAAFLLCLCASTLQLRRLRTIPVKPAPSIDGPSVSFWSEAVLLWYDNGGLEAAVLDWTAGTCVRRAMTEREEIVLPRVDSRILCICGPEVVTTCFPPTSS